MTGVPEPSADPVTASTGVSTRKNQELEIRSPWCMLGYLDAPDLTAAAMRDGWFRTGDLAAEERSGAVRLIGRANDLILRSGNKISPLEIEAVFSRHESVAAALATGVKDPARGEVVHLAIVQRSGRQTAPEGAKGLGGRLSRTVQIA